MGQSQFPFTVGFENKNAEADTLSKNAPCFLTSVWYIPKSITGTKNASTISMRIRVRFSEAAIVNDDDGRRWRWRRRWR